MSQCQRIYAATEIAKAVESLFRSKVKLSDLEASRLMDAIADLCGVPAENWPPYSRDWVNFEWEQFQNGKQSAESLIATMVDEAGQVFAQAARESGINSI